MPFPVLARKVRKYASEQFLSLKLLLNGRGFSKFKKAYRLKGELGHGGFGIVYRAVRLVDNLPVAVKFIERQNVREWGRLDNERVPMEICMLARCTDVSGVIILIDWFSLPEGFLIVMERPSPCVDLFDFIHFQGSLDEDIARHFFRQIVQTAVDCVDRRVLHRDLKDENVVIDLLTGETRLVDFGAATVLKKQRYADFQGTRLYCPPEWFLHSLYLGKEAAVWSLGVLLYNMLNGRLPFLNEKDICTAHLLGPLPFFASLSAPARDLVCRCLAFDPFSRPILEQILGHPWCRQPTPGWAELCESPRFRVQTAPNKDGDGGGEEDHELRVIIDEDEMEALAKRTRHLLSGTTCSSIRASTNYHKQQQKLLFHPNQQAPPPPPTKTPISHGKNSSNSAVDLAAKKQKSSSSKHIEKGSSETQKKLVEAASKKKAALLDVPPTPPVHSFDQNQQQQTNKKKKASFAESGVVVAGDCDDDQLRQQKNTVSSSFAPATTRLNTGSFGSSGSFVSVSAAGTSMEEDDDDEDVYDESLMSSSSSIQSSSHCSDDEDCDCYEDAQVLASPHTTNHHIKMLTAAVRREAVERYRNLLKSPPMLKKGSVASAGRVARGCFQRTPPPLVSPEGSETAPTKRRETVVAHHRATSTHRHGAKTSLLTPPQPSSIGMVMVGNARFNCDASVMVHDSGSSDNDKRNNNNNQSTTISSRSTDGRGNPEQKQQQNQKKKRSLGSVDSGTDSVLLASSPGCCLLGTATNSGDQLRRVHIPPLHN